MFPAAKAMHVLLGRLIELDCLPASASQKVLSIRELMLQRLEKEGPRLARLAGLVPPLGQLENRRLPKK